MRKLVLSLATIVLLVGAIGASTLASFSDTETSLGNTFAAGTFDLKVKDNNEPWLNGVTATWTMTNMKPGDELAGEIEQLNLRNVGSEQAKKLDISVANLVIDPYGPESDTEEGTTDMDRFMEITWMEYEDSVPLIHLLDYFVDLNGNGWKDLDDLEHQPIVGLPAPVGDGRVQMGLRFRDEADNDFQGDTVVSTFSFTLRQ